MYDFSREVGEQFVGLGSGDEDDASGRLTGLDTSAVSELTDGLAFSDSSQWAVRGALPRGTYLPGYVEVDASNPVTTINKSMAMSRSPSLRTLGAEPNAVEAVELPRTTANAAKALISASGANCRAALDLPGSTLVHGVWETLAIESESEAAAALGAEDPDAAETIESACVILLRMHVVRKAAAVYIGLLPVTYESTPRTLVAETASTLDFADKAVVGSFNLSLEHCETHDPKVQWFQLPSHRLSHYLRLRFIGVHQVVSPDGPFHQLALLRVVAGRGS